MSLDGFSRESTIQRALVQTTYHHDPPTKDDDIQTNCFGTIIQGANKKLTSLLALIIELSVQFVQFFHYYRRTSAK